MKEELNLKPDDTLLNFLLHVVYIIYLFLYYFKFEMKMTKKNAFSKKKITFLEKRRRDVRNTTSYYTKCGPSRRPRFIYGRRGWKLRVTQQRRDHNHIIHHHLPPPPNQKGRQRGRFLVYCSFQIAESVVIIIISIQMHKTTSFVHVFYNCFKRVSFLCIYSLNDIGNLKDISFFFF